MFDSLSSKLQSTFRNLRGVGKISEANVADSLREVRMALLEADVNFKVARDFIERVKTKSIGAEVVQSIQPGQQIVKIIHDELVELLGSQNAGLNLGSNPTCILMVGLHGSGKTTSSGKLARLLQKQGRQPLLVAADVYRPAAMDQLETLGKQLDIPVFVKRPLTPALAPSGGEGRGEGAFHKHRNVQLFSQRVQLVHGRRAINVRRDEQRLASLFLEQPCELATGSRLAGAVQTDHQDATRIRVEFERGIFGTEQVHEFIVDDFDDLLAGLDALNDLGADGFGFDALDEVAGDLEIHVGLQQRHADLAQGIGHVGLGDFSEPAQVPERVLEFAA